MEIKFENYQPDWKGYEQFLFYVGIIALFLQGVIFKKNRSFLCQCTYTRGFGRIVYGFDYR